MAKQRSPIPKVHWKISISAPLAVRLENILFDPVTKKPKYGSRAKVLERMLTIFVERVENGEFDIYDD